MCNCIETTDALLKDQNAGLVFTIFGKPPRVVIETRKIDSTKRGRPPAMLASFCPFCGEKYEAPALSEGVKP